MNQKPTKNDYLCPELTIVQIAVEHGFADSATGNRLVIDNNVWTMQDDGGNSTNRNEAFGDAEWGDVW